MRNQVSGVLPKALESRIAISGLIPDLPFTTLQRVPKAQGNRGERRGQDELDFS
jgi:hypothetical protein